MKKLSLLLIVLLLSLSISNNAFAATNQFTLNDFCSTSNEFYTTFIPKVVNKSYIRENSMKVRGYVKRVVTEKNFTTQSEDISVLQDTNTGRIVAGMSDSETALRYLFEKVYPTFNNDMFIQLLNLDSTQDKPFYGKVEIEHISSFVFNLNSDYESGNLIKVLNSKCQNYRKYLPSNLTEEQITKIINTDPDFNLKKEYQYMKRMLLQNKKGLLKDTYFKRMSEKVVKYFVVKEIEQIVRDFMEKDTQNTMESWSVYLLAEG